MFKLAILSFFIAAFFAQSGAAAADELYDLRIIRQSQGGDAGSAAQVDPGSILPIGAKLRFELMAEETLTLTISYASEGAEPAAVLTDFSMEAGQTLVFPSEDEWVALPSDSSTHAFSFTAKTSGDTTVETVNLTSVPQTVLQSGIPETVVPDASIPSGVSFDLPGLVPSHEARERFNTALADAAEQLHELPTLRGDMATLVARSMESVVLIVTDDSVGTGTFIDDDGSIITNWHVIDGYAVVGVIIKPEGFFSTDDVIFSNIFAAKVESVDRQKDLALLQLTTWPRAPVPMELGSLDDVKVAMQVHAVGHPVGEYWSYTKGVISQVRPGYEWDTGLGVRHKATVIQTQTPLSPGNSGGPLFTDEGQIIGVNSFIYEESKGLNYAVSVKDVTEFLSSSHSASSKTKSVAGFGGRAPETMFLISELYDDNGNGVVDAYGGDIDNNGTLDTWMLDENEDGVGEHYLFDTNENGKIDMELVYEMRGNKEISVWYFDDDEDGWTDASGIDFDGDGTIDRYEEY